MGDEYLQKPLSLGGVPAAPLQNDSQRIAPLSPYLNYDPRFLKQSQPEFIFPEGSAKQRGRFELAFSQIGSSVMTGAAIGGIAGFYNGIKATAASKQYGKLRRTQLLNHIMKQGSATANTLGTITVMYSGFGVILQWARGEEDEVNTVLAGTATGLLYKASSGLRKCALGGGIGFTLTAIYCLYQFSKNSSNSYGRKSLY